MFRRQAILLVVLLFSNIVVSSAQIVSNTVLRVETEQFHSGTPLGIRVELENATTVDRIDFVYRSLGQTEFKHSEMRLQGNVASIMIPERELAPPFLEYYLTLYLHNSEATETYPLENASEHPLRIDLQGSTGPQDEAIIILAPEPNEVVASPEELLISFSLLRADSTVNRSSLRIFIDGADVSSNAVISNDIVVVPPPAALRGGNHSIKIEVYSSDGSSAHVTAWDFILKTDETYTLSPPATSWRYTSNLQAETRNENISSSTTPYNRLLLTARGDHDQFRIGGSLYVTNEETERRQPQNRYFIGGESRWLKLGYGDHYPVFPDLIMTGKRVRGFEGNITVGFFNLDISKGDILRRVESDTVKTFPFDSLSVEQSKNNTASFGPYDQNRWAQFRYGTFSRDLLVIRPSFGRREETHFGFTYLKSKDDITSILYGGKPRENLVLGTDMLIPLDNHNVEISGQAAFSATNNDITNGTFSDERIDSIYGDYSESSRNTIRRVRDIFSNYITINENLIPLNLTHTPTLAYETGLLLNYFNNYFKFTYLRHGNNFESFGQTYVRKDVEGFNIIDRVRLANNQVLVTGGFERLQDNTAETKPATATNTTTNINLSWFPKTTLPNMTIGYLFASNENDMSTDSLWRINDRSHRFLVQLGKSFTFWGQHTASLSVSTSTRDDQTRRNLDAKNTMVSLSNSTSFSFPLQTLVSLMISSNKFSVDSAITAQSITTNYTSLYATARYKFLENKLSIEASISPTFGDIERMLFDVRSEYSLMQNLSLLGQVSIYMNKHATNDVIWSFILRVGI